MLYVLLRLKIEQFSKQRKNKHAWKEYQRRFVARFKQTLVNNFTLAQLSHNPPLQQLDIMEA